MEINKGIKNKIKNIDFIMKNIDEEKEEEKGEDNEDLILLKKWILY